MATSNETATYIGDLPTTPTVPSDSASGGRSRGGAEIRKAKEIMKVTFPNVTGEAGATHTELNFLDGATAGTVVASKAVVADASKDVDFGTGDISATDITSTGTCTIATADINGGAIDGVTIGAASAGAATFTSVTMTNAVTKFSTDGTLDGDSDSAVPTEKAVKTYVDTNVSKSTFVEFENTTSNISASTTASSAIDTQTITIPTRGFIMLKSAAFRYANDGTVVGNAIFGLRIGSNLYSFYANSTGFFSAAASTTYTTTGSPFTRSTTVHSANLSAIDIESAGFVTNNDTGSQSVELYIILNAGTGTLQNTTVDFRAFIEVVDLS